MKHLITLINTKGKTKEQLVEEIFQLVKKLHQAQDKVLSQQSQLPRLPSNQLEDKENISVEKPELKELKSSKESSEITNEEFDKLFLQAKAFEILGQKKPPQLQEK